MRTRLVPCQRARSHSFVPSSSIAPLRPLCIAQASHQDRFPTLAHSLGERGLLRLNRARAQQGKALAWPGFASFGLFPFVRFQPNRPYATLAVEQRHRKGHHNPVLGKGRSRSRPGKAGRRDCARARLWQQQRQHPMARRHRPDRTHFLSSKGRLVELGRR